MARPRRGRLDALLTRRGNGHGRGLLRRARFRVAGHTRGKKRQRVDVAVRFGGQADPEVDVRLDPLGVAARADRADGLSFLDRSPCRHADRSEMDERDRVAVGRANRQAEPFARKLPGKRHDARRGSLDVGACVSGDVDPTMLAARVRIVLGDERAEHRAFDGPRPGRRRRAEHEGEQGTGRADE